MPLVTATSIASTQFQISVKDLPDACPRCHHHMQALLRYARCDVTLPTAESVEAQVIFQCPRLACGELFIARYRFTNAKAFISNYTMLAQYPLTLIATEPRTPRPNAFPSEIATLSPMFVKVYNQASAAEDAALEEIAGPAYGKALEFLVKDYLIARGPSNAQAIRAEFLGTVIATRIDDGRSKACAKRAAWLRNDETHYERRWEGKDLGDLKTLIRLTVNWVESSVLTDTFVTEMPDGKK